MTDEYALTKLSADQTAAILDHAPVAIYVSAADSKELLYVNRLARELFFSAPYEPGTTCYQVAGFKEPCPFCTADQMSWSQLFVRKFQHPVTHRSYQLNGQLIDWDGRTAHIEYITDITEEQEKEEQARALGREMQDIVKAIPGGVAIYKVSDIFETKYFSDGLPELTGYTQEEYRELCRRDAAEMIYREDREMVTAWASDVIESRRVSTFEFRKQHRDGHIVWVRVRVKWMGEEDGCPLLHCVFHNISDTKEAQLEMDHLINSIPGGIASYRIEDGRFIPTFYSDGVLDLSGHTRGEFADLIRGDALDIIYEADRDRVVAAARAAVLSGDVLDVSYRMRHKNGNLVWIHLNGRRMGPLAETVKFYAVFTGMSAEAQLFQSIANETADGIYVIDRENYDLLYANESKELFNVSMDHVGQKCYEAMRARKSPCQDCTMKERLADGQEYEVDMSDRGRFFSSRYSETNWNGIPAYVKYVRDVTEEVKIRREKERLEQYFGNVVKYLPGGVAVARYMNDGRVIPEFLSDGFAAMTGMTLEEAWQMYGQNAMAGVHPDDLLPLTERMTDFMAGKDSHCEIVYRLKKGDGGYLWVKNSISVIRSGDESRIYANYHDITREREEQEKLRWQYNDLIMQHYRKPGPNVLILGHCNITRDRILEIDDQTDSGLLAAFSPGREAFFTGIAGLVVEKEERQAFLDAYLNEPSLAAYRNGDTEVILKCFIRLPKEKRGRYARFKVNLVKEPDTGDITGILTVTDITEHVIAERILHQMSVASYDYVLDVDLEQDTFTVLAGNGNTDGIPRQGSHCAQMASMLQGAVVPKDRARYKEAMEPAYMYRRLREEGSYTFSYAMTDRNGDIRTKNMAVSAVDLRIGRVCIVRTDITDSVREQRDMLEAEHRAKEALEKALAQAEEASRAKSDFLSSMSHDIRTPMNAIIGMTELAFAHLDERERLEDCLGKISFSSKHLLNLINDILDMSKIERAKITLNREKLVLPGLIGQLADMLTPQAESAGLSLHVTVGEIRHPYFYGDSLRINQILINILGNAVKFTQRGGEVELRAEELSAAGTERRVRYRFTVRDTGVGMSEDFQKHIFEPFTRSHKAEQVEGTGLGLSITKGLVDLMEGKISVQSRPNQGTAFRVELEFDRIENGEEAPHVTGPGTFAPPDRTLLEGRFFLVAEDNAINSEILCELLRMYGADCVVRTDGAGTVQEFLDAEPGVYDAILMDIQMPGMNGYEATRAIRGNSRSDAGVIPIIAMTANAFSEDIQAAREAGMTAHVAKPIDVQVLLSTLSRALGITRV